jgi:hypothetical protein
MGKFKYNDRTIINSDGQLEEGFYDSLYGTVVGIDTVDILDKKHTFYTVCIDGQILNIHEKYLTKLPKVDEAV